MCFVLFDFAQKNKQPPHNEAVAGFVLICRIAGALSPATNARVKRIAQAIPNVIHAQNRQ